MALKNLYNLKLISIENANARAFDEITKENLIISEGASLTQG